MTRLLRGWNLPIARSRTAPRAHAAEGLHEAAEGPGQPHSWEDLLPWIKLDDHFDENPKVLAAGPVAAWVWLRCLAYCNRNLTDGFVPETIALERCASVDPIDAASRLERAGLWEPVEGGYQIHDYLDYQPSRAKVLTERQATKKRVTAFRARNAVTESVTPDCNAVGNTSPVPVPVPVSVPEPEKKKQKTVAQRFVKPALQEVEAYCRERRNGIDPQAFLDHYESNGWRVGPNPMKDWKAAVRTWEARRTAGTTLSNGPVQAQGPKSEGGHALKKAIADRLKWEKEQEGLL